MATAKSNTKQARPKPASTSEHGRPQGVNALGREAAGATQAYRQQLGICTTCSHLSRCLFVKAARQPIQFCEEFDDKSQSAQPGAQAQPVLRLVATDGQGVDPGLCVNCDSRLNCMHRQPGVPMYQCEDYC